MERLSSKLKITFLGTYEKDGGKIVPIATVTVLPRTEIRKPHSFASDVVQDFVKAFSQDQKKLGMRDEIMLTDAILTTETRIPILSDS